MTVMHHDIGVWPGAWAQFTIEDGVFKSAGGAWPGLNGLSPCEASLEDARYVYALVDGQYLLSTESLPYGVAPGAEAADLLAWQDGEMWHIKRLVAET